MNKFRALGRYVILQTMNEKDKLTVHPWIQVVRGRGWQNAAHLLLDALEPMAPVAAQMLWMFQPVVGVFGNQKALRDFAEILDAPQGVDALRQQLDDTGSADRL